MIDSNQDISSGWLSRKKKVNTKHLIVYRVAYMILLIAVSAAVTRYCRRNTPGRQIRGKAYGTLTSYCMDGWMDGSVPAIHSGGVEYIVHTKRRMLAREQPS